MKGHDAQPAVLDTPPRASSSLARARSAGHSMLEIAAEAIRGARVLLAYQPVVCALNHDRVAFHEGLARIVDSRGRIIPAGAFIDLVEQTDLGRELDTLALEAGLRALGRTPALRLSLNLSARTIDHRPWEETLDRWLRKHDLIAERLILEITESSAISNPARVADFMKRWQAKGVCFAMDDFGAGYTALRYFKDFRFDIVKIDGQFIRGIHACADNRALTSALVSIAQHFDMMTVAEFVETAEDAATLRALGVDCLQGYHFSAPRRDPFGGGAGALLSAV